MINRINYLSVAGLIACCLALTAHRTTVLLYIMLGIFIIWMLTTVYIFTILHGKF